MHTAQGNAARSRTPDTEDSRRPLAHVPPHKERALWNFLTWSFFLAQILAADQLVNGQANAAGDLDLPASDAAAEAAALRLDGLMPDADTGNAVPDDVGASRSAGQADDGVAVSMQAGRADGPGIILDAIPEAQSQGSAEVEIVSGGHVPSASAQIPAEDATPSIANDIHGGLLDVVNDTVDPLLDTVENLGEVLDDIVGGIVAPLIGTLGDTVESAVDPLLNTVEVVVSSLDESLGAVTAPLLGTLGDAVPDVVAAITGGLDDVVENPIQPLEGAVELAMKGLAALAPAAAASLEATDAIGDVLASAGELTFPIVETVGLDDLFIGSRYTDYNLALQAKLPLAPATESSDAAVSSSNPPVDVLAALSDVGDTELLDNVKDGLHLPHIAIPGVLDDAALRGLGDGIV
jgi:hypothetical protein